MYRNVTNRIPSPPTVQTEPEDLSSPNPSGSSSRSSSTPIGGGSTPLSVPGAPSSSAAAAAWAFSNNKLLVFCDIVLKHANYPHAFLGQPSCDEEDHAASESSEETKSTILIKNERESESPLNSVGESARESTRSSTSSTDSVLAELEPEEVDKETFESVTCWCGKPFAGRPMIECDKCLVWYHMSCEQVRRNNIPQLFQCSKCKEKRRQKKRSSSGRDDARRSSKGSSSGKKRKSSSFSSSSSSGIPGSASPQSSSDVNLSPFPAGIPQDNNHHLPPHHEPAIKSSTSTNGSLLLQDTSPATTVTSPAGAGAQQTSTSKDTDNTATPPARPRHRKSKSSPNGTAKEKRKSGGGNKKGSLPPPPIAADSSTEECRSSTVVSDVPVGLSSAADVVGDTNVPTPGCQPPRLLPCFESATPTHSSATAKKNGLNNSHSSYFGDDDQSNNHDAPSCSQRSSLPPPKLQPQVCMTPPSPPPLLLSSNFVVDHQPQTPLLLHTHPHQSKLQIHHQSSNQTGVIVGGGDSNPINNYQYRP